MGLIQGGGLAVEARAWVLWILVLWVKECRVQVSHGGKSDGREEAEGLGERGLEWGEAGE